MPNMGTFLALLVLLASALLGADSGIVTKVGDGDTFTVDFGAKPQRVRLYAADAFEMGQRELGRQSRGALADIAPPGTMVLCVKHGTSHDRIVMQCGRQVSRGAKGLDAIPDIGEAMVRSGWAYVWTPERAKAKDWLGWRPKPPGSFTRSGSRWKYNYLMRLLDAERSAADTFSGGWGALQFGSEPSTPAWIYRKERGK